MARKTVQLIIGGLVIVVHLFSFAMIMVFKTEWLSMSQRFDVAIVLLPVTAAYVMAIVKAAVDAQYDLDPGRRVNLNYLMVVFLITAAFLGALLVIIIEMPSPFAPTIDDAKRYLAAVEIGLGGSFGYIASDLFGKIEKVTT